MLPKPEKPNAYAILKVRLKYAGKKQLDKNAEIEKVMKTRKSKESDSLIV